MYCVCVWIHVGQLFACLYAVFYLRASRHIHMCVWYISFFFLCLFSLLLSIVREVGERERKQKIEKVNINYESKSKCNNRKFCGV